MSPQQKNLIYSLAQVHLRATLNDLEFPKAVRDQTAPLLADAEHKMRSAKALYGKVNTIHKANEDKRLKGPEGKQ